MAPPANNNPTAFLIMTVRYSFYCGLDTNGHDVDARAIVEDLAAQFFPDGHSIREERGRYLMRTTGEVINEDTLVVTWLCMDSDKLIGVGHKKANGFAAAVKDQTYQESVLVITEDVYAVFA